MHSIVKYFVNTKTMESRTCRLCKSSVAVNRAVSLFSAGSIFHKLPTRIENLLEVSVHEKDGLASIHLREVQTPAGTTRTRCTRSRHFSKASSQ